MAKLPTSQERSRAELSVPIVALRPSMVTVSPARCWWIQQHDSYTYLMSAAGPLSVYHPNQVFTGCGWDAQSASLLFKHEVPRTILLLGLGGGTAARQCRHLFPQARITAIEANPMIIEAARSHFHLDRLDLQVICDRAEDYLKHARQTFDAIIDDAWPVSPDESRSAWIDLDWVRRVLPRLRVRGVVAINTYARHHFARDYLRLLAHLRSCFPVVREVALPNRITTVLVAGSALQNGKQVRAVIPSTPADCHHALSALSYQTR